MAQPTTCCGQVQTFKRHSTADGLSSGSFISSSGERLPSHIGLPLTLSAIKKGSDLCYFVVGCHRICPLTPPRREQGKALPRGGLIASRWALTEY